MIKNVAISKGGLLQCPLCYGEYQHFEFKISEIKKIDSSNSIVHIPMLCENGHRWLLCLDHHEGNTCIYSRVGQKTDKIIGG